MNKLQERIKLIVEAITKNEGDLDKSRKNHKLWREHAEELDDKAQRAENHGHIKRAEGIRKRAKIAHAKAIFWKGKVRRQHGSLEKKEKVEANVQQELKKFEATHGPHFIGENKVRGGTYEECDYAAQTKAMANYQAGTQPGYYSMEGGTRDYAHGLNHYPSGRIWDCSTYNDAIAYCCGHPSPSGPQGFIVGGYTGTILEFCTKVTGEVKIGDAVVFLRYEGDTVGHHVEKVYDPKAKRTTGHGDSAINIGCDGDWNLFGDGLYVIVRPPRTHAKN
jgi:hypothetical protein